MSVATEFSEEREGDVGLEGEVRRGSDDSAPGRRRGCRNQDGLTPRVSGDGADGVEDLRSERAEQRAAVHGERERGVGAESAQLGDWVCRETRRGI